MHKYQFSEIPDFSYTTIRDMFIEVTEKYPKNIALQMKQPTGFYKTVTYRELRRHVWNTGTGFTELLGGKGAHLGILSENRIEWCVAYLAAACFGMAAVPIDAALNVDETAAIADYSDIRCLCFSEKQAEKAKEIHRKAAGVEHFISFDGPEPAQGFSCREFQSLGRAAPQDGKEDTGTFPEVKTEDTASVIFTSGTTGLAKGVVLSHGGITANVNASIQSLPIDSRDNFITVLPLHHTYPTTCSFLSPLTVGGTVTIAESIVGAKIIANIHETEGTILIGVPLLYDKLRQGIRAKLRSLPFPKKTFVSLFYGISAFFTGAVGIRAGKLLFSSLRKQAGLNTLRLLVAGGGPLKKITADFFEILGFNIVQGYGMSENGPLIATNTVKYGNNASVGIPVKYTDIRISNPNRDGVGEIIVKSPSLMKGYYNNPEATKEMFTGDGYLKTGDLGTFDRKGFLYIKGRNKNLIVTEGGKNIYPEEIEEYFADSQVIAEIMVTGRKTDKRSTAEEVVAVCYPDREKLEETYGSGALTEDFIRQLVKGEVERVNRKLEGYKKIQDIVIRANPFEKTASQKIKRYLYDVSGRKR